jgi:uncharacterized protein YbaA (DUF1428 family)
VDIGFGRRSSSASAEETPMPYVDGFVLPVPKARLDDYKALAKVAGEVWMGLGALSYTECVGEDVPPGKLTSFPLAVQLKEDEVVIFSWVTYASRADRDRITKGVMEDQRLKDMIDLNNMPFDGKRLIMGGFESFVTL